MNNNYLITVSEAAKKYNIGRDKLYALIRSEKDFPYIQVGSKFLINVPRFESWIDQATDEQRRI